MDLLGILGLPKDNPFTTAVHVLLALTILSSLAALATLLMLNWVWIVKKDSRQTLKECRSLLDDSREILTEARDLLKAVKAHTEIGKIARQDVVERANRTEQTAKEVAKEVRAIPDKVVEKIEELRGNSNSGTLPIPPLPPPGC